MKLLHIDASVLGDNSVSRQLSAAVVQQWRDQVPGLEVSYRDLDAQPVPHLRSSSLAQSDPAEVADAEQVLAQFLAADVVVIGSPMYNFSVASTLKAWIDRLAVAGRTFKYTENGAFFGIDNVEFVRAEGIAYSPQHRTDAIAQALAALPQPEELAAA